MSKEAVTITAPSTRAHRDLLASFVADCGLREMTNETVRSYRSNVRAFLAFLRTRRTDPLHVGLDELRIFLADLREKDLTPSTIGNYFAAVSALYEFLAVEGLVDHNPVLPFRKRYLRGTGRDRRLRSETRRRLLSVEEMSLLVRSTLNIRQKAMLTLLAKTGVRRNELIQMDIDDIDWKDQSVRLKPRAKRSSLMVFFDDETSRILRAWIRVRETQAEKGEKALFIGEKGKRVGRNIVYKLVTEAAERVGLHDPESENPLDHFTPHCCRHFFTTHLLRNGMPREYVKELRGDARSKDSIDVHYHIDREDLRRSYLGCVPELGL